MDPNEVLARLREFSFIGFKNGRMASMDQVEQFCDLVNSLDDWLSQGGFLPNDWQRCKDCEECRKGKPHGNAVGVA